MIVIRPLDIAMLFVGFIPYNSYICNHSELYYYTISHYLLISQYRYQV